MEGGVQVPQWVFGLSTYAFASPERIVCTFAEKGLWELGTIDTRTRTFERIDTGFTDILYVRASPGRAVFIAGSPREPLSIVEMNLYNGETKVLRRSANLEIGEGYISEPQVIEFPTENGLTAYGFYYAPKNRDFGGPSNEKPLLLVKSHGGRPLPRWQS
jgi:dipeptidyl aminopeptidase/acylaminoacyl peptidase